MSYSVDPITDGCYEGTSVLVNKFDIRDDEKLAEVEAVISSARNAEWLNAPRANTFDFEHYKAINRYLFSDLYEWAGMIRSVNLSKRSTVFCPAAEIEHRAALIFARLKNQNFFREIPHDKFVEEIVDFYCRTNELHPFREGNGRTQRTFITQLIRSAGYYFSFSEVDADLLMLATIQAAHGVDDILREIFRDAIKLR